MPALKLSLQLAKANHHRALLLLAGNNDLACSSASKAIFRNSNRDLSDQINGLLGSEINSQIFDSSHTFDERLFAACAGTIRAGGLLLLLTPPLDEWAKLQNSDLGVESNFINRLIRKIRAHATLEIDNFDLATELKEISELSDLDELQNLSSDTKAIFIGDIAPASSALTASMNAWQIEQKNLIDLIVRDLNESHPSTIVVQANRGRGKSALIGQAIKNHLAHSSNTQQPVTITSNRRSACSVLLDHAEAENDESASIRYLPLDQAINTEHDLLIVEEAGSISLPMLSRLTNLSKNIIFATTVQGYEGAGRGFALRFSKQLDVVRPDWIKLEPVEPIRWAKGDPLEAFVNDALLLETQLAPIIDSHQLSAENAQLSLIDRHQLSIDDPLLEEVVALLVQAHYQTTAADLRNFLDQENILIFVQRIGERVTGAALIALEGEIPKHLHEAIVNKERRLSDQILPQLLAQSAASTTSLAKRFARVIRIAIHPELHRQGFGTELLKQLSAHLDSQVDVLGASFGADNRTLSFWLKQDYQPIHYGYKTNARSGLRSVCVVKNIANDSIVDNSVASSLLHLNLKVAAEYGHKPSATTQTLINACASSKQPLSTTLQTKLLSDFNASKRSFFDTCGYINALLRSNLSHAATSVNSDIADRDMLDHMQLLLDESTLAKPKQKRAAEQALRNYVSKSL